MFSLKKLALALVLGIGITPAFIRADAVSALQPIILSGSLQVVTVSPAGSLSLTVLPATVENLVSALHLKNQDPERLAFFYDTTTNAIVLTFKTFPTAGFFGPTVATVFAFGPAITLSSGSALSSSAGDCATLNGRLAGTYTEHATTSTLDGVVTVVDEIEFITSGVNAGQNYLFRGTIRGLRRN